MLLFFATPSKSEQISWIILSVLLLVDTIVILAVPRVRGEAGWVGIVSVLWATVISAWGVSSPPLLIPWSSLPVFRPVIDMRYPDSL